ncbi:hypothetical protein ACNVED_08265 [Legionella sp. D16C41]|uniref:hypothetical protein n=1 Tax=Legionella sp. D16C41 TaxID=3402688 RepID=UPI003AF4ECB1
MRSIEQIEEELSEAKKKLDYYQNQRQDYDNNDGAERHLFFNSLQQLIDGKNDLINKLENELEEYSKRDSNHTM